MINRVFECVYDMLCFLFTFFLFLVSCTVVYFSLLSFLVCLSYIVSGAALEAK